MADNQPRPDHVIVDIVEQPIVVDRIDKPVDVNVLKCVPVAVQPVLPPDVFRTGNPVKFITAGPPPGVSGGTVQQVVGEWVQIRLTEPNTGIATWVGLNTIWVHARFAVWL